MAKLHYQLSVLGQSICQINWNMFWLKNSLISTWSRPTILTTCIPFMSWCLGANGENPGFQWYLPSRTCNKHHTGTCMVITVSPTIVILLHVLHNPKISEQKYSLWSRVNMSQEYMVTVHWLVRSCHKIDCLFLSFFHLTGLDINHCPTTRDR